MVTIFCDIDDFCRPLLTVRYPQLAAPAPARPHRCVCLTLSEVMTILVFFPGSHDRTFQHFYRDQMLLHRRAEFPGLPSYPRFVELIPWTLLPWCAYRHTRQGQPTGLPFIDSLPIRVCHNRRLSSPRVFAGLAQRGKGRRGWFYGFPLPWVIHEQGEVLGLALTPGHTDDRRPVRKLVRHLWGKLLGDRGSMSQEWFEQLWEQGLQLITKRKRNRKNKLLPVLDKVLRRKRALIECVNDQWKNSSPIEPTRHRSATNGMAHILAAVAASTFQPKKPALDLSTNPNQLSPTTPARRHH